MSYDNREFKGESLQSFVNDYVVVDIETTGLSPQHDKIIEIGAIKVVDNVIVDKFEKLISIDCELSPFITKLTGITNDMLKQGNNIENVLIEFDDFIGDNIIVGHNVHFDYNFLYDNYLKYLDIPLMNNLIDTLRLSKQKIKDISQYKLNDIALYFNIENNNQHRSLNDAICTHNIYKKLKEYTANYIDLFLKKYEDILIFDETFFNKNVCIKGNFKKINREIVESVLSKLNCKLYDAYYSRCSYIITNDSTFKHIETLKNSDYISEEIMFFQAWKNRAIENEKLGLVKIISESEFCRIFNIPIFEKSKTEKFSNKVSAKDIKSNNNDFDITHPLYLMNCVVTGTLINFTRKEVYQAIADVGGMCQNSVTKTTNFLILGNNDYNPLVKDGKSNKQIKAEQMKIEGKDIEIISEDILYDMLIDHE